MVGTFSETGAATLQNFKVAVFRFCFRKTTRKAKFSEFFLSLRNPLVVSFNQTHVPTSKKYLFQQGLPTPNS